MGWTARFLIRTYAIGSMLAFYMTHVAFVLLAFLNGGSININIDMFGEMWLECALTILSIPCVMVYLLDGTRQRDS